MSDSNVRTNLTTFIIAIHEQNTPGIIRKVIPTRKKKKTTVCSCVTGYHVRTRICIQIPTVINKFMYEPNIVFLCVRTIAAIAANYDNKRKY